MRFLRTIGVLVPCALAAQSPVLTSAAPRDVGMSDVALRSAVALYQSAVDRGEISGAVLLIARHGKIVLHEAIGLRDVDKRVPMDRTTMFRASSNMAPVTATAVAILADRGKLSFNDPVMRHLPSWDRRQSRDITIHQLLSHTSGIEISAPFAPTFYRLPWNQMPTLRSEADRIGKVGAKRPPGTSYFYTSAGLNALGAVVETLSGQSLDAFFRDEIFAKLGMEDSYSIEDRKHLEGKLQRMGPTYSQKSSRKFAVTWKPGDPTDTPFARGSGGLITTARDYAVFMQMLLNGGAYGNVRLLRPETVRAMLTAHTPAGARPYGYGMRINDGGVFTHNGSTGTYAWGDPARDLIVVAFAQTSQAMAFRPRMMAIVNCAVDSYSSPSGGSDCK